MSNKHDILEMLLKGLRNDRSDDDDAPGSAFASSHRGANGSVRSHEDDEHEQEHEEDEHDEHDGHLSGSDDDAVAAPAGTTADPAAVTTTPTDGTTGTTGLTGTTTGLSATDAAASSSVADDDLDDDDLGDDTPDSEDDDDASAAAGGTATDAGVVNTGVAAADVDNAPGHHGEHGHENSIRALLEKFLGQSQDDDSMGLMGNLMPLLNAAQNAGGGEVHGRNALLEFGTLDQFVNWLHEIEAGATDSSGQSSDLASAAAAVEHQLVIIGLIAEPASF